MARASTAATAAGTGVRAALVSRTGVARAAWRVLSATACAAALGLVVFHVWLFARQLLAGQLLDPDLALRWATGGLLVAALVWLRRRGVPLLYGRRALSVWLLVALLHCWGAAASAGSQEPPVPVPEASASYVLPITAGTLLFGLGLLLVAALSRRLTPPAVRRRRVRARAGAACRRLAAGPPLPGRAPPFVFA
ncbi:MAG TPA: hypothetical protein VF136_11025 [Methylomirabilota bacterium]